MTSPEHTLVGILGAFSMGLHTRFGWAAIAYAAVVSNIPDLDGLPMLVDMARFEGGHRVWGHNLIAICVTAVVIGLLQVRWQWIERIALRTVKFLPSGMASPIELSDTPRINLFALIVIGIVFQCLHLICDITVSGGQGLSDWHVKPFWPINDVGYVFPLIPWGDVGPTFIMMLGVIGIAKMGHTRRIATLTLCLLCLYLLSRGYARGVFIPFGT